MTPAPPPRTRRKKSRDVMAWAAINKRLDRIDAYSVWSDPHSIRGQHADPNVEVVRVRITEVAKRGKGRGR